MTYGFFALAAGARSAVQLSARASEAPFAYGLSAVAAATYLLGALLLRRAQADSRHRRWAARCCALELAGVVLVGTTSVLLPGAFPDQTVWSYYGAGYAFVPLILPVLALTWLVDNADRAPLLAHRRPSRSGSSRASRSPRASRSRRASRLPRA